MKPPYLLLSALLILFTVKVSSSQQLIHNTYLLKNLDNYSAYSACWGYVAPNGREYAIIGVPEGTSFVDITDSSNIREVDFLPGPYNSTYREMKCYSHYCYIVTEEDSSAVQIADLRYLPDSVHHVRDFVFPGYMRAHTISQEGPYIYLNGGNIGIGGITVLDLTQDPENPVVRGGWQSEYVHDSRIINDTIWAANISSGYVSIIDAVNKDSLRTIGFWNNVPNGNPHNIAISPDRKYAYVTDEPQVLKIWNIQNLEDITFIRMWQPTGITTSIVHNVELYGNYLIAAHYTAGIRILDVSNPYSPVEIAWYDTYPLNNAMEFSGCWGVFKFPSGKIIGSDRSNGLFVIKTTVNVGIEPGSVTLPSEYYLAQNYPNPFNPVTSISYEIIDKGHVTLEIYNSLGEKVAALVNETLAPGRYTANFDAANSSLSSGIYFYRLSVNGFSDSKKMVLIK
jgi:choice-of-anchor B domain-containing protein